MNIVQSIILGLVEGATEFLPVSSTAHLIMTSNFLKLQQTEFVAFFEVFIQSGAILAVVILYFETVMKHKEYIRSVILSFIPTGIIGFALYEVIKTVFFNSNTLIISMLFGVGVLFLVVERMVASKKLKLHQSISKMTTKDALITGTIQAFAVVPGVSRAGAVIVGMMFLGYKRSEAALYSFLLAVPTILAASIFDLIQTDFSLFTNENITMLTIGFFVSFFSALFFVKWLISYLQKNSLVLFGWYRIILAGALALLML